MLKEALAEGHNVDYKEVSFILGRLSALQKPELIPIVLENLQRLYPVAHSLAAFFKEFAALNAGTREQVANALLRPILDSHNVRPSEYYCIWALSLFHHHRNWDHAETCSTSSEKPTLMQFVAMRHWHWPLRVHGHRRFTRPSTCPAHLRYVARPFFSQPAVWVPMRGNTSARVYV